MGFDPRSWAGAPPRGRQVTANLDALLAENEALRREVAVLRQQLSRLQARGPQVGGGAGRPGVTSGSAPAIGAEQVRRWADALERQPRWRELRVGASMRTAGVVAFTGLRGLLEELERRSPGLDRDLRQALHGPQSKARLAVRAAFALYGRRAPEWLTEAPDRVVNDLLERIAVLEEAARQAGSSHDGPRQEPSDARAAAADDPERAAALALLGLRRGASREAVKRAHRRLVKTHHPDRGGDADTFRRIHAAYQLLLA